MFVVRYQYVGGSNIISLGGIVLNPDMLRRAGVAKELFILATSLAMHLLRNWRQMAR